MRLYVPLILFLLTQLKLTAQVDKQFQIPFPGKAVTPAARIDEQALARFNVSVAQGPAVAILQFKGLPDAASRAAMAGGGLRILQYLGGHAYVVIADREQRSSSLQRSGVRAFLELHPEQKIDPELQAQPVADRIANLALFPIISTDEAIVRLRDLGFSSVKRQGYLEVMVPAGKLNMLAALPFVAYIELPPPPYQDLNDRSRGTTGAMVLQSPSKGLTGAGVVLQIAEIGDLPYGHLDFRDRSITGQFRSLFHATHVTGIAAGAGLVDERLMGYAPGARVLSRGTGLPSEGDVLQYGVSIANHSYGAGTRCTPPIAVNSLANMDRDKRALDYPQVLNVFGSGNYADTTCPRYPPGYNTIDLGGQAGKSALTVGATDRLGAIAGFSSKGPVYGGRLKPEIVAPGVDIFSTIPGDGYGRDQGTSMSSPAVAGGLALLYQRYAQLHGGAVPENTLMKALICNTASDKGTIGPDYAYGFGMMNLPRALDALEGGFFYKDSVAPGSARTRSITVPPNTAQLKVMLNWNDRPASPLTRKLLINDLDLSITSPNGSVRLPFILDTVPSRVTDPAVPGVDHLNNIEQVVIDHPAPGTYQVRVAGYEIGEGDAQSYHVVYDLVPDAVRIVHPATAQVASPGETLRVQWEGTADASSYALELSLDDGVRWQVLASSIAATENGFDWTVPDTLTTVARFRVTRQVDGKSDLTGRFRIIGTPVSTLAASQCPGSIALQWTPVKGATDYEVMRYQGGDMVHVAFTNQTQFTFRNLSEDSTYWVTVRARSNGETGRRAIALSRKPDSGDCLDPAQDGDLSMRALVSPNVGRIFTSTSLGLSPIVVQIRNNDDVSATGFTLSYSVDGSAWTTETYAATLPPGALSTYAFVHPFDFTTPAERIVRLAIHGATDTNPANDTVTAIVRQLPNAPMDLSSPFLEDLEAATVLDYGLSQIGLTGIDRFDYRKTTNSAGRLRIGSHFPVNKTRALELMDSSTIYDTPRPESITATFNLAAYDTASRSVGLDFSYALASYTGILADTLMVRGSDTSAWIYLLNPSTVLGQDGTGKVSGVIIGDSLRAHGQNYSSSVQVKWAPYPWYNAVVIDDIKLYDASRDLAMVSIDSLPPNSCGLTSTTPIRVTVQNRGRDVANGLTLRYRVDGGPSVSEGLVSLPAGQTASFTFTQRADLSTLGSHTIEAWIDGAADANTRNDTMRITFRNLPVVSRYPDLQDFEHGVAGWYTEGENDSWAFGNPASERIHDAASGAHAWKTNLTGNYNSHELSYLYSGCYDLSSLSRPVISISAALNIDSCTFVSTCDAANLQYTVNGKDWKNVLPARTVYKWSNFIVSYWQSRWHVMSLRLPDALGVVQFRFQFRTNGVVNYEGFALDDVHVYDSTALIQETGPSLVERTVPSAGWTEFLQDGRSIAAIDPNAQDLGTVSVHTYLNEGPIRQFHGQHYLDRTHAIRFSKTPARPVKVRLYFTDREADSIWFSKICPTCTRPENAFRLGVNIHTHEKGGADSSIRNNENWDWSFIPSDSLRTVPIANGYYVEFPLAADAEIRLSDGGLDGKSPMPVSIKGLKAEQIGTGVQLDWTTASEINIRRYEVEMALGNAAYANGQFTKIGEVTSSGRSASAQDYSFIEHVQALEGVRYYRLRALDTLGEYSFSAAVPLYISKDLTWKVYPNPTHGAFHLMYQARPGTTVHVSVFDAIGHLVRESSFSANGFVQEGTIDPGGNAPGGIYLIKVDDGDTRRAFKVIKR